MTIRSRTSSTADGSPVALEVRRNEVRNYIAICLPKLGNPTCEDSCDNSDEAFQEFLQEIFEIDSWPPPFEDEGHSIEMIYEVLQVVTEDVKRENATCAHTMQKQAVTVEELRLFGIDVERLCEGLCLRCIQEDCDDQERRCSIKEHK